MARTSVGSNSACVFAKGLIVTRYSLLRKLPIVMRIHVCALVRIAQTVTLGGPPNVAAAEDFATRSFQDPWDMNERTDFGWFLHGADQSQS